MRRFLTIRDRIEILLFKIKAKRLACRLINITCKEPTFEALFAEVDKEYEKVNDKNKSGIYADLIRGLKEDFIPCFMDEETEE